MTAQSGRLAAPVNANGLQTSLPVRKRRGGQQRVKAASTMIIRRVIDLLVLPIVVAASWQVFALLLDSPSVPSTLQAIDSLATNLQNPRFVTSISTTFWVVAISFFLSGIIGVLSGVLIGLSPYWRDALGPIIYAINGTPKVIFYPIFLLALGLTMTSRIAYGAFGGILVTSLMIMEGTANLDPTLGKVAKVYRLSRWRRIRYVILPALIPQWVSALRVSFGIVFISLIIAELFSSNSGIGHEIIRRMHIADGAGIMGIVIIAFLTAILPTATLRAMEERLQRHRPLVDKGTSL